MTAVPAFVATEPGPATLQDLDESALPDGDVTVAVRYSSLNYKDGLAVSGKGKIIRSYPLVCGIDLAGTVAYPVLPTRFASWSAPVHARPAPMLGEHNREILGGELGLTVDQLDDLERRGVIGRRPAGL